ncbi:polymorphic toxin type 44 domain-containing protein [Ferrimonas kyonanensis]|uniref:polymorphic toxin type 44 domain-containing protein n=1 Tax=Ferrimonas kyonanensis TaxID=364763 RepID=UPI0012EC8D2E|nr:polymorphic toxin type 44 domain-containing protein [Ferrimonas kyonanensis]
MSPNKLFTVVLSTFVSFSAIALCTISEESPAGKADGFNKNQHIKKFKVINSILATHAINSPVSAELWRAAYMTKMFAPRKMYDLKNSQDPNMRSSQEFGNYFYGFAAQQMGYSKQESLKAGAIVQQYQNYNNDKDENYRDLGALALGLLNAVATGAGDNADDADPIAGGWMYGSAVYDNDENAMNSADSCDENNSQSGSSSGGGGTSGDSHDVNDIYQPGWLGGSFIGDICFSFCGGTVTITDLKLHY